MTKSEAIAADVAALLRARNPLLWIVTREEARVERYLGNAADSIGYVTRTWDVAQGVADEAGQPDASMGGKAPEETLSFIASYALNGQATDHRGLWVLRDLPTWLAGPSGAMTLRQLRNLVRLLPEVPLEAAQTLVVLSPSADVPPELSNHATVIEWPLPDREEIAAILDERVAATPRLAESVKNGAREAAIEAAIGLSGEEAAACYAQCAVKHKAIIPSVIAAEKKRVIAREKVLEWFDPLKGGLESVGGLENMKDWMRGRAQAYTPAARAYGLPAPKGCLIVGIPGTGKSMAAKALATHYQVPLLRLDMGALKSKYVGESEANLRKAFRTIEALGRCVVWIDEIEKALQGSNGESADGGVSADALGGLLNWMQERQGEAFVVATANDVSSLPPELLRKGRWDEIWWVDLPTATERAAIVAATLKTFGKGADVNHEAVALATESFTGAEIAALVPEAMFTAFGDGGRDVLTRDLLAAAAVTTPLAKTAKEKITKLREWSTGRARPASTPEAAKPSQRLRALDI